MITCLDFPTKRYSIVDKDTERVYGLRIFQKTAGSDQKSGPAVFMVGATGIEPVALAV